MDQTRVTVSWREGRDGGPGRWRWTVVLDGGKTSHGWADTKDDAERQAEEALAPTDQQVWRVRGPRSPWGCGH